MQLILEVSAKGNKFKMANLNKSKIFENFNGIILVNKKSGITSFGVIKKMRWIFF